MVDLSTEIAGIELRNPVIAAAGPPTKDGEAMVKAAAGGAGGLIAKTISIEAAAVPRPSMAALDRGEVLSYTTLALNSRLTRITKANTTIVRGMLNAELWSDIPYSRWLEKEYKIAKGTGLPLIASIGYTGEELSTIGPLVEEAGVDGIEFSLHYLGFDYRPILDTARALRDAVEVPIFAKVSPHIMNLTEFAKELERLGVNGIVAINSLGPCLHIDIETGKPVVGGEGGYGWLSGPAIKPLAVRCVADIARAVDIPVIGVGGITSGQDAVEHIMAGASAVQICTGAILEGPSIFGRVSREIGRFLEEHGYRSVDDIKGVALEHLPEGPLRTQAVPAYVDEDLCKACGLCVTPCIYGAVEGGTEEVKARIDRDKCYGCGLCITICPERAISFEAH